jgi:hypothetical protein
MNFSGIDISAVSKIEFAFSQEIGEKPLKIAEYPNNNVEHIADNLLGIVWTAEDTKKFKAGEHFYCDTRITLSGSAYQPETPILKLRMNPTLFEG